MLTFTVEEDETDSVRMRSIRFVCCAVHEFAAETNVNANSDVHSRHRDFQIVGS